MEKKWVPTLDDAWTRNLEDLRRHRRAMQKMGILDHETALVLYMEIVERVEQERLKGKVSLQVCPSYNAWEGKCSEPASIVSVFCAKHASLYDDRQIFFSCCSQCKEERLPGPSTSANVAFYYHQKGNLCFHHQMKAIGNRKKPPKRRQSQSVLEVERLQRISVGQVIAQYLEKNTTTINTVPSDSANISLQSLPSSDENTPSVSPDRTEPYYHDEALNLDVQEVVLDAPLAHEDFRAALEDVFEVEEDDENNPWDSGVDLDMEVDAQDSLTTHVDWTLQVLDEMEWRTFIEMETLR